MDSSSSKCFNFGHPPLFSLESVSVWIFSKGESVKEDSMNLTPSPLPEEERSIPKDWADKVEEESKEIPEKESDIEEERVFRTEVKEALVLEIKKGEEGPERWSKAKVKEMAREFVHGLKLWWDLKPRRVQALCACVGSNETSSPSNLVQ